MDKLSAGIVFGTLILAGVSVMVNLPPQVGIGIFMVAVAWGLLALPKWGPLRKHWESKPTKWFSIENGGEYEFGSPGERGFPSAIAGESLMLSIVVGFHITPSTVVQSVQLDIKGKRLRSNWEPHVVGDDYGGYVYFAVPKWVSAGRQKVRLVAFADEKWRFSSSFPIEFPKQN